MDKEGKTDDVLEEEGTSGEKSSRERGNRIQDNSGKVELTEKQEHVIVQGGKAEYRSGEAVKLLGLLREGVMSSSVGFHFLREIILEIIS